MSLRFKLNHLLSLFMFALLTLLVLFTTSARAGSMLIPSFIFVESAYIESPAEGSDQADAFLTLTNLHPEEPLVLLSVASDLFAAAKFYDSNNAEMEQVVIQPGERISNLRLALNGVELSASHSPVDFSFLIRRGLEAMDPVDAIESTSNNAFSGGIKAREAGIPNEDDYILSFDVRN